MNRSEMEQQFQYIFIRHYPKVKRFAKLLLRSEEDAEDVVQDIFLKLWVKPEIWMNKDETALDDYLFIMTRNHIFNMFNHLRVTNDYKELMAETALIYDLTGIENVLENIYCNEILLLLHLTMEKMPQRRRELFKLSRFGGLSHQEIAERYGLSVRTVEHQIYLALSELKKVLFVFVIYLSTL